MRNTVPHLGHDDADGDDADADADDDADGDANDDGDDPLTIMSNLFSSSLTPSTMVIVCPIFTIPLTSLAYGPLPT